MRPRLLTTLGLFVGCVAAAGAGGYLAVRQVISPEPVAIAGESTPPAEAPTPVLTTEAAVTPDSGRLEPSPVSAPALAAVPDTAKTPPRSNTRNTRLASRQAAPPVVAPPPEPPALVAGNGPLTQVDSVPEAPVLDAPEPPALPLRQFTLVTLPEDSVIGVQLETTVSSASARVEDRVRARVTRDVVVGGQVAVPAGSRLFGHVTLVEEGGRVKEASRIGVRFHTIVLSDGREVPVDTATIYRAGESPAGRTAARVGGAAAAGSIIGAILGGGRGAAIGAVTGAGAGSASAMTADRKPAELRSGQTITVRLASPASVEVER